MKKFNLIVLLLVLSFSLVFAQKKAMKPEAGKPYNEGRSLAANRNYEQAIPKFQEAIKADDQFPEAYYMLGYCYKKLNNFDEAEKAFNNAIKVDQKFEVAYIALGNLQDE